MNVRQELKTFTDQANEITAEMMAVMENVLEETNPQINPVGPSMDKLDRLSRGLAAAADTIKDLAYRLKSGQERVTTVEVHSDGNN